MQSTGLMIGHFSLALSLGSDFPNPAMHRAPPERQEILPAAVGQGATYPALRGISEFAPPGRCCLLPEPAAGVFQAMEANYLTRGAIWE